MTPQRSRQRIGLQATSPEKEHGRLVVWVVVARDFPEVSPCRSESGGGVSNESSRPPSRSCQRAGFLASSASPTPRFCTRPPLPLAGTYN